MAPFVSAPGRIGKREGYASAYWCEKVKTARCRAIGG